jgi:K+/H+ antiporter YhaU regulatory subunit KhtT
VILLKEIEGTIPKLENAQFDIMSFCVGSDKNFAGKILSTLNLRQKYGVNVVGIQRLGDRITDIKSDTELREDDVLLLAGTKSSIEIFRREFAIP